MPTGSDVIILGVIVQVITLLALVFKIGDFTGKTTTIVSEVRADISEMKSDMKKHVGDDVIGFRDVATQMTDLKVLVERRGFTKST